MKIIEDLFKDMFEVDKVTDERLATFTLDHLQRIIGNNPGNVFDGIRTATSQALGDFGTAMNNEGGNIGDRKGQTILKNLARLNFSAYIRQKEGLVKSTFGETSLQYAQFFPGGLSAFNKATDTGYAGLITNIVTRATQYEADLGVAFKDAVIALAQAYNDAELAQTAEKGEVEGSKEAVQVARAALTRQLTINALTIALQFPLDESKAGVYFETSLLFAPKRKRIYKGTPAAGATDLVAKIVYEAGKFIKMKNKGATHLAFQMFLIGNPVGVSFTLKPGEELQKREDDFFSNADQLKVTNTGTVTGMYEVQEIA